MPQPLIVSSQLDRVLQKRIHALFKQIMAVDFTTLRGVFKVASCSLHWGKIWQMKF